jgi:putative nucleotidyltransferase with HDIG domain
MKNRIEELFANANTLPTLPAVVQKIFTSINDPNVGARQLADIVTSDQTLTAKVLKLVNSSFFGLRGKVQNISHAVTMLGFSTLRQLCLGVSIYGQFRGLETPNGFSGQAFWMHSISTAVLARELAKTALKIEPDICYTIGLVHDVGKLLFIKHHKDLFLEALRKAEKEQIPLYQAEKQVTGADHAEIGNWIFHKWNLPRDSRRAVKAHHSANMNMISPAAAEALTGVIYFANQLSHHLELGNSGNPACVLEKDKFKKFFGVEFGKMNIDRVRIEEEALISLELLGISGTAPVSA